MAALAVVVAVAVVSEAVGTGAGAAADAAGGTFSDMMSRVDITIFDAGCVRSSVGYEVRRLMKMNLAKGE